MAKTPLSQLVVLAYADEYRAAEVLATLQRLRAGAMLDAQDAMSVTRRKIGASHSTMAPIWAPTRNAAADSGAR